MQTNTEASQARNRTLTIIAPAEEPGNKTWKNHAVVVCNYRSAVSSLMENKLLTIYNTFRSRYPNGIDYSLWDEKIEWKDYLKLEVQNKKYFVTCDIWNENMRNEHISLSVFSNLDFWSSKSRKIKIYKDWKLSVSESRVWENDEQLEWINMHGLLDEFLKKISTY
ncbi:MAG: hypothetical protein ACD_2C00182G0001 [uncultured bacterium (gcode 4)]|uniref:Uncharacterized protein n=1 Tax=uncultured bacterium (gcode 4) TaxID=1234023 RepID=K2FE05_9BACT|nr:MAG: hypothetical protein ACD_2C00182G0001 [uncultured bacterium (gcode 4)]